MYMIHIQVFGDLQIGVRVQSGGVVQNDDQGGDVCRGYSVKVFNVQHFTTTE